MLFLLSPEEILEGSGGYKSRKGGSVCLLKDLGRRSYLDLLSCAC
jgi:hypothetical protein